MPCASRPDRLTPITLTGHHKAEYFSAVFEGVLVAVAPFLIFRSAYLAFLTPKLLEAPIIGLAINAGASFINGVWAWLLLSWGRRWQSPALVADGRHVMTDVLTSGGVIIGVALVSVTGWLVLDFYRGDAGRRQRSVVGLRDGSRRRGRTYGRSASTRNGGTDQGIDRLAAAGAIEAHDVRTRHAGRMTFVEFHLVVPGEIRVAEAHEICDRIEAALKADMGGEALVTIHVEPEDKAKLAGVPVL